MEEFEYNINSRADFDEMLVNVIKNNDFVDFTRNDKKFYINLRSKKNGLFLVILHTTFKSKTEVFRIYKILRKLHQEKQINDNR